MCMEGGNFHQISVWKSLLFQFAPPPIDLFVDAKNARFLWIYTQWHKIKSYEVVGFHAFLPVLCLFFIFFSSFFFTCVFCVNGSVCLRFIFFWTCLCSKLKMENGLCSFILLDWLIGLHDENDGKENKISHQCVLVPHVDLIFKSAHTHSGNALFPVYVQRQYHFQMVFEQLRAPIFEQWMQCTFWGVVSKDQAHECMYCLDLHAHLFNVVRGFYRWILRCWRRPVHSCNEVGGLAL